MIFSGQVGIYKCPACNYETQTQYSTAFFYWAGLIAVSCGVLFPIIRHRFGPHHGWYGLFVIFADIALLAILLPLTTKLVNRRVPADRKCPRCATPLKFTGNAFYDFGLIPNLSDSLVGLGFLLTNVIAIILLLRK